MSVYAAAALKSIAISQAEAGDQPGALQTALEVPVEMNRNGALVHIAVDQGQAGDIRGSLEMLTGACDKCG